MNLANSAIPLQLLNFFLLLKQIKEDSITYISAAGALQYRSKILVFLCFFLGWDKEFEIDWSVNRLQHNGKQLFFQMARDHMRQDKMVILSHDMAYRPGGKRDEQKELQTFLKLSKDAGYNFETLDYYLYTKWAKRDETVTCDKSDMQSGFTSP